MADQEPGRRGARWMIGLLCVTLLWAFAVLVPAPLAIERPGPVVDALGDFPTQDGEEPVIFIVGAETFPTSGELNVLSVSILGSPQAPPNWFEVGGALLDPTRALVPIGDLYPEGSDDGGSDRGGSGDDAGLAAARDRRGTGRARGAGELPAAARRRRGGRAFRRRAAGGRCDPLGGRRPGAHHRGTGRCAGGGAGGYHCGSGSSARAPRWRSRCCRSPPIRNPRRCSG